ncbi:MAG: HDOD domain-containing protein [Thermodesulfobacteriota bacterium]
MPAKTDVCILFVDDEPHVLQGLKRVLRPLSRRWRLLFAESGREALTVLEKERCDVLVTDMCMPGMSGAELLEESRRLYPEMVRMILSGQTDQEQVLKTFGSAHVYLSKPSDEATITKVVKRALDLRGLLPDEHLRRAVSRLRFLPVRPDVYEALLPALAGPAADLDLAADLVSQDQGLAVKVLQVINSPFFGLSRSELDIKASVKLLGLERLEALMNNYRLFLESRKPPLDSPWLKRVWRHSVLSARLGRLVAQGLDLSRSLCSAAYTAGLLHGTGRLVLAACRPEECEQALATALREKTPWRREEQEVIGVTHAEVGGFLMGLWGLPQELVSALLFHHTPREGEAEDPLLPGLLHVSDYLAYRVDRPHEVHLFGDLDLDVLAGLGWADHLERWTALGRGLIKEMEKEGRLKDG